MSRRSPHDARRRGRDRAPRSARRGSRPSSRPRCASAASRSWPRKPVQSFAPEHDSPTDAEVLARGHRRGPARRVPGAPLAAARDGAADGGRRARRRRRSRSPTSSREITRQPPRDAIVLVESVGGVRSPLADDGDTVDARRPRCDPTLVVLVADAELGTINVVRLSVDVLAPASRRRVPQPLRPGRRAARAQPRLARDARGPRSRHRPRGPRQAASLRCSLTG